MATAVQPERIARDLRELWAQLAQDHAETGSADTGGANTDDADTGGVLKACSMTLVVAAADDADADRVRETLGALMHQHPSRAIVLRAGTAQDLGARVFAECWKPFGKNQQICAEGIEITPGGEGVGAAARFLVPLLVPDLPVVLWCRGAVDQTYMYRKRFQPLYELAHKIIFDTRGVADAEAGGEFLNGLRAPGRHIADLHWTRLTGWREVLAHLFDDGAMEPGLVTSARVGHGSGAATTCAVYMARWIRSALPGVRVAMSGEDAPAGIHSVTLETAADTLRLSLAGEGCLQVEGCGRNYRSLLPPGSEEALMGAELKIPGADPVFERVLGA